MAAEGSAGGGDRKSSPVPTKSGGTGARSSSPACRRAATSPPAPSPAWEGSGFTSANTARIARVSGVLAREEISVLWHYRSHFALREGQVIKTDATNILIRHLQLNKQKSEAKDAGSRAPGESSKGKRSAARSLDVNNSAKRPNFGSSSGSPAYAFREAKNQYRGRNGSCPVSKRKRHFFKKQYLAFHSTHCNHLQLRGHADFYGKVVSQQKGKRMN